MKSIPSCEPLSDIHFADIQNSVAKYSHSRNYNQNAQKYCIVVGRIYFLNCQTLIVIVFKLSSIRTKDKKQIFEAQIWLELRTTFAASFSQSQQDSFIPSTVSAYSLPGSLPTAWKAPFSRMTVSHPHGTQLLLVGREQRNNQIIKS